MNSLTSWARGVSVLLFLAAAVGLFAVPVQALDYYYTNFDSSLPPEFTSVTGFNREAIQTTNSPNFTDYKPFAAGSWLRTTSGTSQSATLTLTDLPEHDLIDLKFLIGTMDSIDGSDGPFQVKVDGTTIYSRNYGAAGGWNPGEPVLIVRQTQLGYNMGTDPWWGDGGYNMGVDASFQSITHTADSVTIEFISGLSSPGNDESYAIDNVEVDFRKTPYYQANFNSGLPAEFSVSNFAVSAVDSLARPAVDYLDYGMSGNWLRTTNGGTQTATLTLTDLPGHSYIDLDFLLGALDSIDSGDGPFTVSVDGETIFSLNIGSGGGAFNPGDPITLVRYQQLGGNLGTDAWWRDAAYHMGLMSAFNHIAHSDSTLTIEFTSGLSSASGDESYAIDNLTVVLGVPEPSTVVGLVGLAIAGGIGLLYRRRRR